MFSILITHAQSVTAAMLSLSPTSQLFIIYGKNNRHEISTLKQFFTL